MMITQEDPVTSCLLPEARLTHCASCWKVFYHHQVKTINAVTITEFITNMMVMMLGLSPGPPALLRLFTMGLLFNTVQVPKVYVPQSIQHGCESPQAHIRKGLRAV